MVVEKHRIEDCTVIVQLERAKSGATVVQLCERLIGLRIGLPRPVVYCISGPSSLVCSVRGWFKKHAHAIIARSSFVIIHKGKVQSGLARLFDYKRRYKHLTPKEFHDGLC